MSSSSIPSPVTELNKRRFSDQCAGNIVKNADAKRRQTIGGSHQYQPVAAPVSASTTFVAISHQASSVTPSKQRVSLGSSSASAYYFKGLPQTPLSNKKSKPLTPDSKKSHNLVLPLTKFSPIQSQLSPSSSVDASDAMNQSVLSDTTELTASNYILAASSRQKLIQSANKENRHPTDQLETNKPVLHQPSSSIQSTERRLSSSPNSLRKLTLAIKQERTKRLSTESNCGLDTSTNSDDMSTKSTAADDLDVSKSSLDDLFDGLLNNQKNISIESQTSLLVSPPEASLANNHRCSALSSPRKSPISFSAADSASFRLTPSHRSSKLTPTKLNKSPRRVLNVDSTDSPAKRTRSASKVLGGITPIKSIESPVGTSRPSVSNGPAATTDRQTKDGNSSMTTACSLPLSVHRSKTFPLPERTFVVFEPSRPDLGSVPKSILNSAKKRQALESYTRKSVAFGSPEAAEYHIGSPSVSLTPMPSNRAKAMYAIPSATASAASSESSDVSMELSTTGDDDTIDIEVDLNELLRNATSEALDDQSLLQLENSTLSGRANGDIGDSVHDKTVELEASLNGIIDLSMPERTELMKPRSETTEIKPSFFLTGTAGPQRDHKTLSPRPEPKPFIPESSESDSLSNSIESMDLAQSSPLLAGKELISSDHNDEATSSKQDLKLIELGGPDSGSLNTSIESTEYSQSSMTHLANESMDMTDMESIRSLNTNGSASKSLGAFDGTDSPEGTSTAILREMEENTVELEADISAILAIASQGSDSHESLPALKLLDRLPKVASSLAPHTHRMSFGYSIRDGPPPGALDFGLSNSPAVSSSSRRRSRVSDASQRRFSLAKSRLSISSEGEVVGLKESITLSQNESLEEFVAAEPFDITSNEISHLIGFETYLSESEKIMGFQVAASSLFDNERHSPSQISYSIQSFVEGVCGEVEQNISNSPNGEACFEELLQAIGEERISLQRWLRGSEGASEIRSSAVAVTRIVEHEWVGWEKSVIDFLISGLEQRGEEFEPEIVHLDQFSSILDDLNEALSITAGKAARKARRLSMTRQKDKVSQLGTDIEHLERQLEYLNNKVASVNQDLQTSETIKSSTEKRMMLRQQVDVLIAQAEESQRQFISVIGLSRVAPISVQDHTITLSYTGCNPMTCLTSRFTFHENGSIKCQSDIDDCHFNSLSVKREKVSKDAASFMKSRSAFVADLLSTAELDTAVGMSLLVRQLDWTLGRVESTAQELTSLQQRFAVVLKKDPDGGSNEFLVQVTFEGSTNTVLMTTFELNPSYPFGPLNVSLEPGHCLVDIAYLQKHLTKSAKSGFGYLSRACDVISAVLKSV